MASRKPLTDAQKAAKNEKQKEYRAKQKAARQEAAQKPTSDSPTPEAPTPGVFQATMMIYDIPTDAKDANGKKLDNPSGILRRIGFRANLSCWVIPSDSVPHTLINDLRMAGADVDLVKFDASEGPRLVRMAIDRMSKEIEDQIKRTRANLEKTAGNYLHDSEITGERDTGVDRYENQTKYVLGRLESLLDDLDAAREKFGIRADQLRFGDARKAYDAMNSAVLERAAAYTKATQALRGVSDPTAQALAAEAGKPTADAPHYAMADVLRENGKEAEADALSRAFGEGPPEEPVTTPEPEPTVVEEAPAEDHVFSLSDEEDTTVEEPTDAPLAGSI